MEKKLIAIDLDGTLLNSKHILLPETERILTRIKDEGHVIVLATGRPWRAIKPYYDQLGLKSPVIAYNGAYVFYPHQNKVLRKVQFSNQLISGLINEIKPYCTSIMCETEGKLYSLRKDEFLEKYFPSEGMELILGDPSKKLNEPCFTFVFKAMHRFDETIKAIVNSRFDIEYRHWTKSFYAEAFFKGIDKGTALEDIRKDLGFEKENMIAFGDSDNDLSMMERCGQSYAMLSCKSGFLSSKFEKTVADHNHDGVAKTLEKLLF